MLKLVKTQLDYFDSILSLREALKIERDHFWAAPYPAETETPSEYIARLQKNETEPEPPLVPETMFWGLVDNTIVGRLSIRHQLNARLEKFGGHIGYEVHPEHRRCGYATQMLRLALQTPKALEIGRLLLTCAPDNVASNKTILSNGGQLEKKVFVDFINADRNHYWIDLT